MSVNIFLLKMLFCSHMRCIGFLALTLLVLCKGSSDSFVCSDGSRIPSHWMNDGFCDCTDCGDEITTHVSNLGFFECSHELDMDGYPYGIDLK